LEGKLAKDVVSLDKEFFCVDVVEVKAVSQHVAATVNHFFEISS